VTNSGRYSREPVEG